MSEEQKQPTAQEISEPQQPAAQQQPAARAMESQVTSKTPATKPAKNPKKVAAGKMIAERTRLAREEHKQKADKYDELMAKESAPAPEPSLPAAPAAADSEGFTTNQWISILGIRATLLTTYVKRDNIKAFFEKKTG